jgi:hypothetical protein
VTDSDERWIVVPNWDKFQHYTDRAPVWIKVYTELNSRDDWRALTFGQRGVLVSIWTEYPRCDGRLRVTDLWSRVGQRDRHGTLEALNHAGFIQLSASKPLALARSREKEVEKEKKVLSAHAQKRPVDNPGVQRANVPTPTGQAAIPIIERLIRNGVITDLVDLEAELLAAHLSNNVGDDLRKLLQ